MKPILPNKFFITLMAMLVSLALTSLSWSAVYQIENFTPYMKSVNSANINNNDQIAWRGFDSIDMSMDVFFYDGVTTHQLTDSTVYEDIPEVNDNGQVVWAVTDGEDYEVFLYDGNTVIQLTDNWYSDSDVKINNQGQVIWRALGDIFLYNGSSIVNVSNSGNNAKQHNINNNGQVVWKDLDDIYFFDGSSIINLSNSPYVDQNPQINDNGQVVWNGYNGTSWEIYLYDGNSVRQLSNNGNGTQNPQINNLGQVVWMGQDFIDGYDWEIYFYDGNTTMQISNNIFFDGDPQINDLGQITWHAHSGYPYDIYLYDGSSVIELTNNSTVDKYPQINNNGMVMWLAARNRYGTSDIYLARPDKDEDGFSYQLDCNDFDAFINPDQCDIKNDGIDQNCDGADRTHGKTCVNDEEPIREGIGKTCSDGLDNDLDGYTDCEDFDCSKKKHCN